MPLPLQLQTRPQEGLAIVWDAEPGVARYALIVGIADAPAPEIDAIMQGRTREFTMLGIPTRFTGAVDIGTPAGEERQYGLFAYKADGSLNPVANLRFLPARSAPRDREYHPLLPPPLERDKNRSRQAAPAKPSARPDPAAPAPPPPPTQRPVQAPQRPADPWDLLDGGKKTPQAQDAPRQTSSTREPAPPTPTAPPDPWAALEQAGGAAPVQRAQAQASAPAPAPNKAAPPPRPAAPDPWDIAAETQVEEPVPPPPSRARPAQRPARPQRTQPRRPAPLVDPWDELELELRLNPDPDPSIPAYYADPLAYLYARERAEAAALGRPLPTYLDPPPPVEPAVSGIESEPPAAVTSEAPLEEGPIVSASPEIVQAADVGAEREGALLDRAARDERPLPEAADEATPVEPVQPRPDAAPEAESLVIEQAPAALPELPAVDPLEEELRAMWATEEQVIAEPLAAPVVPLVPEPVDPTAAPAIVQPTLFDLLAIRYDLPSEYLQQALPLAALDRVARRLVLVRRGSLKDHGAVLAGRHARRRAHAQEIASAGVIRIPTLEDRPASGDEPAADDEPGITVAIAPAEQTRDETAVAAPVATPSPAETEPAIAVEQVEREEHAAASDELAPPGVIEGDGESGQVAVAVDEGTKAPALPQEARAEADAESSADDEAELSVVEPVAHMPIAEPTGGEERTAPPPPEIAAEPVAADIAAADPDDKAEVIDTLVEDTADQTPLPARAEQATDEAVRSEPADTNQQIATELPAERAAEMEEPKREVAPEPRDEQREAAETVAAPRAIWEDVRHAGAQADEPAEATTARQFPEPELEVGTPAGEPAPESAAEDDEPAPSDESGQDLPSVDAAAGTEATGRAQAPDPDHGEPAGEPAATAEPMEPEAREVVATADVPDTAIQAAEPMTEAASVDAATGAQAEEAAAAEQPAADELTLPEVIEEDEEPEQAAVAPDERTEAPDLPQEAQAAAGAESSADDEAEVSDAEPVAHMPTPEPTGGEEQTPPPSPEIAAMLDEAELYLLPQWADYAEVARILDRVATLAPREPRLRALRDQLEAAQRGGPNIDGLLREAQQRLDAADHWGAVDLYEQALAQQPGDERASRGVKRARLLARWMAQLAGAANDAPRLQQLGATYAESAPDLAAQAFAEAFAVEATILSLRGWLIALAASETWPELAATARRGLAALRQQQRVGADPAPEATLEAIDGAATARSRPEAETAIAAFTKAMIASAQRPHEPDRNGQHDNDHR